MLETSRLAQRFNDKLVPNILIIENDVEKQAKELNVSEYETPTNQEELINPLIPIEHINIEQTADDEAKKNKEKERKEETKDTIDEKENNAEEEQEEIVEIMKPSIKQSPADIKIVITVIKYFTFIIFLIILNLFY